MLAKVMPDLDKFEMKKAIKRYAGKFVPKYHDFNILQNTIEDVVQQSTQIWKVIYGLKTPKVIEQTLVELGDEKFQQEVTKVTIFDTGKDAHVKGTKRNADTQEITKYEQQT